jgi:hypothetical protein
MARDLRCGSVEQSVEDDKRAADADPRSLGAATRLALAAVGAVMFGAGIAAVFLVEGNGGTGAAALLAIGAIALALAGLGALPTSLAIAGVQLSFPERLKRLADEARREGRPDVAHNLDVSAELWTSAGPFAEVYKTIRENVQSDNQRTAVMQSLFDLVTNQAKRGQWSPSQARELFETDDEGARVFALAMMRAFKRDADLDLALKGAEHPKSAFEQWQSLTLIEDILPKLDGGQRARTRAALTSMRFVGERPEGRQQRQRKRDDIVAHLR